MNNAIGPTIFQQNAKTTILNTIQMEAKFKGKKDFKGKSDKEPQSQGVKCFKCGGNHHVLMSDLFFFSFLFFFFFFGYLKM